MNISGLFSYQENLNQLLAEMGKVMTIEFFSDVNKFRGPVAVNYIRVKNQLVWGIGDIEDAYLTDKVKPEVVDEILEALNFADIDMKKRASFPSARWNIIEVLDDEEYHVTCGFLAEIVDIQ
jgi:hypothetical protein